MSTSPLVIASLVDLSNLPIGYLLLSSGGVAFIPLLLGSLFLTLRRILQRLSSTMTASVAKPPPRYETMAVVDERESRSTTLTDEDIVARSSLMARLERLENEVEDLRREVEHWKGSAEGDGYHRRRTAILEYRTYLAHNNRLRWLLYS